jgi:hypothetical protein
MHRPTAPLLLLLTACAPTPDADPPEVALGERLFLDTRFAQAFHAADPDDVNAPLAYGDPVLAFTPAPRGALPGPFAGSTMNCRACHLVDEQQGVAGGGVRTYADFTTRSLIPGGDDGALMTPRNSPTLVEAARARQVPFLLHYDGEFASAEALVVGGWTGRNFGWRADEQGVALASIARVLREDDGTDAAADGVANLSYRTLLQAEGYPATRIADDLTVEVDAASDTELVIAAARIVSRYLEGLAYTTDEDGRFAGSPYDRFLAKNGLPREPAAGESDLDYARRLRGALGARDDFEFVTPADGTLALHDHPFEFGPAELDGLRRFLAEPAGPSPTDDEVAQGGLGACLSCHPPPVFTDFGFHTNGSAQAEYDGVHGAGAFVALSVPGLADRDPDVDLPPSPAHPDALGRFRSPPVASDPSRADLGLWSVFANPALPDPQPALHALLCPDQPRCDDALLLPTTLARFKTSTLRDLGQSAPYFHTGQAADLDSVVRQYLTAGALARAGALRNADPAMDRVTLVPGDVDPIARFLRSLDEDYR